MRGILPRTQNDIVVWLLSMNRRDKLSLFRDAEQSAIPPDDLTENRDIELLRFIDLRYRYGW